MKLKYYLRGIGIGITFATVILTISFYFGKAGLATREMTDEQIKERAIELGMVMPEEDIEELTAEENEETSDKKEDESLESEESPVDDGASTSEEESEDEASGEVDETVTYVPFIVKPGESSDMVAANLYKAGLVDSGQDFNKYMNSTGVDNRIQSGTFYVKEGSTYDDIIALLVNKDTRSTTPPKAD
jgi:hypothetical protein